MKKLLFGFLLTATCLATNAENLLLAHADANGYPEGRKLPAGATVSVVDNKLKLQFANPGSLQYSVNITPDHRRLWLSGTLQATDLVPGPQGWQNGRIAMRFLDAAGKQAGDWPQVFAVSGTTKPEFCSRIYNIPAGAAVLLIEPANFGTSGTVLFTDLCLTEAPDNLLIAPNPGGISDKGLKQGAFEAQVADGKLAVQIDGNGSCQLNIPVAPEWKTLKLSAKWQCDQVRPGNADWKNARIAMRFYNAKGPVGNWPDPVNGSGTIAWQDISRIYDIPEGATSLTFEPANFGDSGIVQFQDLRLELDALR